MPSRPRGRSESENGKSNSMAPGQLRQALAYGGTRGGGANGSFNAPSSVPWIDGDEPAATPEAAQATDSQAADADGRDRCNERGVRSQLRKHKSVQP